MPRVNARPAFPGFRTFTHRNKWCPRCTDHDVGYLSAKDRFASSCRNGKGCPGRRQTRRKSKYVNNLQPSLHASSSRENSPNVSAGTSVSSMTMDLRGHRRLIFLRVASMASRRDGAFADSPSRPLHAVDATHGLIPTQLYGRVADVARPHEVAVFYR